MNNDAHKPIGIFDSGIGGLTVTRAITSLLPNEEIIYFGDTAHLPYGDKSVEAIQHYSDRIAEYLISRNCKMVVIACNTASSVTYDLLVKKFGDKIPIVNVIDPIVQKVTSIANVKAIGIIGTKGTIQSNVYERKLLEINPSLKVASLATPLLVPLIEEGFFNSSISQSIIQAYLGYPDFNYIHSMILACTHYPLVKNEIEAYFNSRVQVFDSTDVVAKEVQKILSEKKLMNTGKNNPHHFIVSDFTESFEKTTRIFYQDDIHLEHFSIWD